jgi:hypothetical protein
LIGEGSRSFADFLGFLFNLQRILIQVLNRTIGTRFTVISNTGINKEVMNAALHPIAFGCLLKYWCIVQIENLPSLDKET